MKYEDTDILAYMPENLKKAPKKSMQKEPGPANSNLENSKNLESSNYPENPVNLENSTNFENSEGCFSTQKAVIDAQKAIGNANENKTRSFSYFELVSGKVPNGLDLKPGQDAYSSDHSRFSSAASPADEDSEPCSDKPAYGTEINAIANPHAASNKAKVAANSADFSEIPAYLKDFYEEAAGSEAYGQDKPKAYNIENPDEAYGPDMPEAYGLKGGAIKKPESSPEPVSGLSKGDLGFENFGEYDLGISRAASSTASSTASSDEAFGIVTTGIEPLEITAYGATITAYITASRRNEIRLGTYVIVPYGNENLFAKISKLQYRQEFAVDDATEIHSRRMLKSNTTNEADYKFLAFLDPLCILYRKGPKGELSRRMADRIPRPNTPILPVLDRLEVQTGLNIPKEGIFLGHLSVGGELVKTHSEPETVAYYLRNDYSMGDPLVFRHMLVCGSTGTGKTFLSKNILRQFMNEANRYRLRSDPAQKNPCLVIMDPQDEYSQMFEDNEALTSEDRFSFESEAVAYGRVASTRAFVAKVEGGSYAGEKSRAEQVEFTIPFSFVKENSWLLATAGMSELQYIGLEVLIGDFFKSSVPHTYKNFITHIDNEGTRSYYVDSGKLHESSYDGIVRRVKSSFFSKVFDQDATPIPDLLDRMFKPGQVSVFPTEHISSTGARDLVVLTIMSLIVDNKLSTTGNSHIKNTPIILGLDEAHRYLSNASGEHSRLIISRFADAARQGRKEGLGLFLITQDPQDIDDTVFKQINTKLILNLNNDAAITSLKVPKEYEKRIPFLKKGQMIVHSPDNSDIVEIIGLSNCVVKHQ